MSKFFSCSDFPTIIVESLDCIFAYPNIMMKSDDKSTLSGEDEMIDNNIGVLSVETYENYINEAKSRDSLFVGKLSKTQTLPRSELLGMILLYAVKNHKQDWIDKLIKDKDFVLNAMIDSINNKTLLASIVYYPFYSELFRTLIDLGAEIYKDSKLGDTTFRSNVLMLSVNYGEFENVEYLLKRGLVSYYEVLDMCLERNNRVLLKMFLENTPSVISLDFIKSNSGKIKNDITKKIIKEYVEKH